jgi:hypothetical protein
VRWWIAIAIAAGGAGIVATGVVTRRMDNR